MGKRQNNEQTSDLSQPTNQTSRQPVNAQHVFFPNRNIGIFRWKKEHWKETE